MERIRRSGPSGKASTRSRRWTFASLVIQLAQRFGRSQTLFHLFCPSMESTMLIHSITSNPHSSMLSFPLSCVWERFYWRLVSSSMPWNWNFSRHFQSVWRAVMSVKQNHSNISLLKSSLTYFWFLLIGKRQREQKFTLWQQRTAPPLWPSGRTASCLILDPYTRRKVCMHSPF